MRNPAVAGLFYPDSWSELQQEIDRLFPRKREPPVKALGVVSPHAGYLYSGAVAAKTLGSVRIPETVVILGPNHRGRGGPVAISAQPWIMPWGEVVPDTALIDGLLESSSSFTIDELAHGQEHSLEVQVPFLAHLQPNLRIVPIALSHLGYRQCEEVASGLAAAIARSELDALVVASSDMNHFESRKASRHKDRMALAQIEAFHPEGLYNTVYGNDISMCGVIPVVIAMIACRQLGASAARLVEYTDSGYVSGDTDRVVGYAGVVIS